MKATMSAETIQRKMTKLWRLRRARVLERLAREVFRCECLEAGGSSAGAINRAMGTLGYLWYKDSHPEATVADWRVWKEGIRQLARERAATLRLRLARIGRMECSQREGVSDHEA